jgi:hypothetical protein
MIDPANASIPSSHQLLHVLWHYDYYYPTVPIPSTIAYSKPAHGFLR